MSAAAAHPARLRQLPRLAAILWAFSRNTDWLPPVRSRRTDLHLLLLMIRRGWVRVAYDRYGLTGFIARDGAHIHALYVHPRARGQGVGRGLLADAQARAETLSLWVVEANTSARDFYAANGFVEMVRSPGHGNDENLPDIKMVWPPHRTATP